MRLQLSSRAVSGGAGGPASEQLATMIIISSAAHSDATPRVVVASPVRVRCLGMIAPSLGRLQGLL